MYGLPAFFRTLCSNPGDLAKSFKSNLRGLKQTIKTHNVFYWMLKWEWAFIFDLIVYILAAFMAGQGFYNITLVNGTELETYLKPCWVWRISAVAITLGWINLLVYMRQMPLFGKYIIILNDIIYTFISFVAIFLVFLLSFTFGFHVLLKGTGGPFENFQDAFLKTMIMMSGEFDYGDIFFPEDASSAPFPDLTYAFFIIFFILLALLLLNLLVGLSVADVAMFVEVAELKQMSNRLKFVLNMERLKMSWLFTKIRILLLYCFPKNKFLNPKKTRNKMKEKDLSVDDHKSRMWKQVIQEESREEKKNEMEELREKTISIAEEVWSIKKDMANTLSKLREIDNVAKYRHNERKRELNEAMEDFKMTLSEKKQTDNDERQMEVDRTIKFMHHIGKLQCQCSLKFKQTYVIQSTPIPWSFFNI